MKLLLFFTLTLSLNMTCGNTKQANRQENIHKKTTNVEPRSDEKKSDDQVVEKYGFRFYIPDNWALQTNDFETKNLKGEVKTIETNYVDEGTKSRIRLIFHPGNSGMTLYRYYSKDSSGKIQKSKIGEHDALKIDEVLTRDGKGHVLLRPVMRHKIYMVAPGEQGVLEIVYDLPKDDAKAIEVYEMFVNRIEVAK